jgi:hypothetical protein
MTPPKVKTNDATPTYEGSANRGGVSEFALHLPTVCQANLRFDCGAIF